MINFLKKTVWYFDEGLVRQESSSFACLGKPRLTLWISEPLPKPPILLHFGRFELHLIQFCVAEIEIGVRTHEIGCFVLVFERL